MRLIQRIGNTHVGLDGERVYATRSFCILETYASVAHEGCKLNVQAQYESGCVPICCNRADIEVHSENAKCRNPEDSQLINRWICEHLEGGHTMLNQVSERARPDRRAGGAHPRENAALCCCSCCNCLAFTEGALCQVMKREIRSGVRRANIEAFIAWSCCPCKLVVDFCVHPCASRHGCDTCLPNLCKGRNMLGGRAMAVRVIEAERKRAPFTNVPALLQRLASRDFWFYRVVRPTSQVAVEFYESAVIGRRSTMSTRTSSVYSSSQPHETSP